MPEQALQNGEDFFAGYIIAHTIIKSKVKNFVILRRMQKMKKHSRRCSAVFFPGGIKLLQKGQRYITKSKIEKQ